MKIGIYGGSFNPVHKGHLYVAKQALNEYKLDCVYLMPSYQSPNKELQALCKSADRYNMCRLAVEEETGLFASDYETSRDQISYTYLTMTDWKKRHPNDELFFIMGGDSLDYFDEWRHPEIIASCAVILVVSREGYPREKLEKKIRAIQAKFPADIRIVHCCTYHASSTEIKEELLSSNQCPETLPLKVYQYIKENHLYSVS